MSVSHSPRVRPKAGTVVRRKRRWYARATFARWMLGVIVAAVALLIGCSAACKIARPFQLVGTEKREKARVVNDYKALKKQNQELERQLHYLKTPEGIAQEARKQGFVKPGEVSLVIPDEKAPGPGH